MSENTTQKAVTLVFVLAVVSGIFIPPKMSFKKSGGAHDISACHAVRRRGPGRVSGR